MQNHRKLHATGLIGYYVWYEVSSPGFDTGSFLYGSIQQFLAQGILTMIRHDW